jgi:DNA polymerase
MADLHRLAAALLEDQGALGLEGIPAAALVEVKAGARTPAVPAEPAPATAPVTERAPPPPVRIAPPPAVASPPALAPPPGDAAAALAHVREELGDCTRCKLHKGRKNIVFGVGDPNARLVFVGEGPGADEDAQGEPFVGKAGQLLTKMIQAMGLERKDVYIANVVKCRPPNNRDPEPDEVAACEPFLVQQLGAIRPLVIVTLGKHALHTLVPGATSITRERGKWRTYQGIRMMPTFHPSYLLRDPSKKKEAWQDLREVMRVLGLPPQQR